MEPRGGAATRPRGGAVSADDATTPAVLRLRSLDALRPGDGYELGTLRLGREEIVRFARRFDPHPFHLDEAGGAASPLFGGLVASGLHTLSAAFGRLVESGLLAECSLGGDGMEVRWPAPLRPGQAVSVRVEVLEVAPSPRRRDRGRARLRLLATRIEDGVVVLDATVRHILRR